MGRSLESLSRSRNADMSRDPEGIANYANTPKTFEEHMAELRKDSARFKDLIASLPAEDEDNTAVNNNKEREQKVDEARKAVLETFNKSKNNKQIDIRQTSTEKLDEMSLSDISESF